MSITSALMKLPKYHGEKQRTPLKSTQFLVTCLRINHVLFSNQLNIFFANSRVQRIAEA